MPEPTTEELHHKRRRSEGSLPPCQSQSLCFATTTCLRRLTIVFCAKRGDDRTLLPPLMEREELEKAERTYEVNYRVLLELHPNLAMAYQKNALRLLGIAEGSIKPMTKVLQLVNGRPAPIAKEREMPPAA